jgi:hypothetical protein
MRITRNRALIGLTATILSISLGITAAAPHVPQQNAQNASPLDAAVAGYYVPAPSGPLAQTVPLSFAPNAVYRVEAYPLHRPELAPGDGQQETDAYCNTCHSTRYITMQPPLPAATWETEVNKMDKTFGGEFPSDASAKIIRYLSQHYTPETRRR